MCIIVHFSDEPVKDLAHTQTAQQSAASHMIDLYTNNSNSRKRRMDWDPLDIDQNDSTGSGTIVNNNQSADLTQDKDKNKREKLSAGKLRRLLFVIVSSESEKQKLFSL